MYKKFKKTNRSGVLILTSNFLLFCRDKTYCYYRAQNKNIEKVEVYEGGRDETSNEKIYHIYIFTDNNRNYVFETDRYALAEKTYHMINREIKLPLKR